MVPHDSSEKCALTPVASPALQPMRHRKTTVDTKPASRPLASALLGELLSKDRSLQLRITPMPFFHSPSRPDCGIHSESHDEEYANGIIHVRVLILIVLNCQPSEYYAECFLITLLRRRSLGIAHRVLCYQKRCRVRLQYPWKELWTGIHSSFSAAVLYSLHGFTLFLIFSHQP